MMGWYEDPCEDLSKLEFRDLVTSFSDGKLNLVLEIIVIIYYQSLDLPLRGLYRLMLSLRLKGVFNRMLESSLSPIAWLL